MTLFQVSEENNRTVVLETLPNGNKLHCDFNLPELAEAYMRNRRDIIQNGLEATMQSWHDEEAVERADLELEVKASY